MLRKLAIVLTLWCFAAVTLAAELVESQEYRASVTVPFVPVSVENKYGDKFTVYSNSRYADDVRSLAKNNRPIALLNVDAATKVKLVAEAQRASELAVGSLYGVPKEHVAARNGYVADMPDGSRYIITDFVFIFNNKAYDAQVIRHMPQLLLKKPELWRSIRTDFYLYPIP